MTSDRPIVFIVDDDSRVRDALSGLLASAGLDVAVFGSAAAFLEADKPDGPACLVLDLELPDINGLELQKELAEREAPPIVFVTGHGDVPSSVKAMKAGAVEFLSKPVGDEELLRAINEGLALDRTLRLKRSEHAELQKRWELQNVVERAVVTTRGSVLELPSFATPSHPGTSSVRTLAQVEREHILATLTETNWVIGGWKGAAARLGLSRTTLIARMQRLGISREGRPSAPHKITVRRQSPTHEHPTHVTPGYPSDARVPA